MGKLDCFRPWSGDAYPKRLSHKPSIYYLAYGSNLLPERIYGRCPDAVYAGLSGCYATIEQDANREVPCIVFKISEYDEAMLDKYEGYPKYYYKRKFTEKILFNSGKHSKDPKQCIAYILHEDRSLGAPSEEYMRILLNGYAHWGFDEHLLWTAASDSMGTENGAKFMRGILKGDEEE